MPRNVLTVIYSYSADGPRTMARPALRTAEGMYYFFAHEGNDLNRLWPMIAHMTRTGQLGYFSGYSTDCRLISVYYSGVNDFRRMSEIWLRLRKLGVKRVHTKKRTVNSGARTQPQLKASKTDHCSPTVAKNPKEMMIMKRRMKILQILLRLRAERMREQKKQMLKSNKL